MNSITIDYRTTDGRSPTSAQLLREPLAFIAENHLRLRMMCTEMDRLADATTIAGATLAELKRFLEQELLLSLSDERDDLMPCLLARSEDEDEVPKLAERLQREHAGISEHLTKVRAGLEQLRGGEPLPPPLADGLRALANATRRHLILENAVLLPLARARLTDADLKVMRAAMRKRRGLQADIEQAKM